jgi:hypothetical protein
VQKTPIRFNAKRAPSPPLCFFLFDPLLRKLIRGTGTRGQAAQAPDEERIAIESLSFVCAFWVFIKRSQLLVGETCLVASDLISHSLGTMAY